MSFISLVEVLFLTLKISVARQVAEGFFDKSSLIYLLLTTRQNLSVECHYKPILRPSRVYY